MKIESKNPSSILPSPLPGRGGRGRDLHGKLFADYVILALSVMGYGQYSFGIRNTCS